MNVPAQMGTANVDLLSALSPCFDLTRHTRLILSLPCLALTLDLFELSTIDGLFQVLEREQLAADAVGLVDEQFVLANQACSLCVQRFELRPSFSARQPSVIRQPLNCLRRGLLEDGP